MYQIEEFPEVWADACIRDAEGRFLFLSMYGRDGSLMQFMAAMQLGAKEGGVQRFHLVGAGGYRHQAEVGGADRLSKHTARLPKQNLFGPLSQMWIYDKSLQAPDRVNRIGWALHRQLPEGSPGGVLADAATVLQTAGDQLRERAWQLIKSLSPVALQDHWRGEILSWCSEKAATQTMGSDLYPVLGQVHAMRVSLTDHFLTFISDGVRAGRLRLST